MWRVRACVCACVRVCVLSFLVFCVFLVKRELTALLFVVLLRLHYHSVCSVPLDVIGNLCSVNVKLSGHVNNLLLCS